MKKIEAIIRKSKFDEVVKALHDAEVYFSATGMLQELEMQKLVRSTEE